MEHTPPLPDGRRTPRDEDLEGTEHAQGHERLQTPEAPVHRNAGQADACYAGNDDRDAQGIVAVPRARAAAAVHWPDGYRHAPRAAPKLAEPTARRSPLVLRVQLVVDPEWGGCARLLDLRRDYELGNTRVVANPRGYLFGVNNDTGNGFQQYLVIGLDGYEPRPPKM